MGKEQIRCASRGGLFVYLHERARWDGLATKVPGTDYFQDFLPKKMNLLPKRNIAEFPPSSCLSHFHMPDEHQSRRSLNKTLK